jgi:signal transduction histidine kinase
VDSLKAELKKEILITVAHNEAENDLFVEADRGRLTQLITNVVGNAIKFTDKGSVKVETKSIPDKNRLEIRISDTGVGISEDILPRLFEKFATDDHGEGSAAKGTGLGLYISKAIVAAHNGEISAFNNPSGGATILIALPISQTSPSPSPSQR